MPILILSFTCGFTPAAYTEDLPSILSSSDAAAAKPTVAAKAEPIKTEKSDGSPSPEAGKEAAQKPSVKKVIINPFVPGGTIYGNGGGLSREEVLLLLDAREKKIKDELFRGSDLSKLAATLNGTAAAGAAVSAPTGTIVGCFNGRAMLRDNATQQIRLADPDDAVSKSNHCNEGAE